MPIHILIIANTDLQNVHANNLKIVTNGILHGDKKYNKRYPFPEVYILHGDNIRIITLKISI